MINLDAGIKSAVVILSGGMDSTIAARLMVELLGKDNVHALSFYYGQKQKIELEYAERNARYLGLMRYTLIDISFLGDMVRGVSANISGGLATPTIKEILGDPAPVTEVPFRNGILLMIGAAYAQANNLFAVVTGVQAQDEYSYFDTTPTFISAMNNITQQNRTHNIKIIAPWQGISKVDEIRYLYEMDESIDLLKTTITCYNPDGDVSCGKCQSCAERINAFAKFGVPDPIPYSVNIPWDNLILR